MKVISFDVFGTVFDLSGVPKGEIRAYARHVRQPEWAPLKLPDSWTKLPAHPDAAEGVARLREKFLVVTCSNGPLGLLAKLSKFNNIWWDAIIPLELNKVYKPDHRAYLTVCSVLGVPPADVTMVTANKEFGDLEAAMALGMRPMLIRHPGQPMTIIELAAQLEKE